MKIKPMPCFALIDRYSVRHLSGPTRLGAWPCARLWYPYGWDNTIVWEWSPDGR